MIEEIFLGDGAEFRHTIQSADLRVLNGIVARWWPDPDRFDKTRRSLNEYRDEFPWPALEAQPADPSV